MTLTNSQNPAPCYPADILSCLDAARPWRVAHTKSRREKALAAYLADAGIGYYLPLYKKRQNSVKRVRYSMTPVFSSYVFFSADDFDRHKALRSNHIARVIEVTDQERLVRELQHIEQALAQTAQIYPYDFMQKGQRVRVTAGPFKDIEGFIVRKDRNYRLVISVSSIMQSISVQIDADAVEPIT